MTRKTKQAIKKWAKIGSLVLLASTLQLCALVFVYTVTTIGVTKEREAEAIKAKVGKYISDADGNPKFVFKKCK